ncbi:MAG: hypothetical protein RRZ24_00530 [Clostridia bacterium]
MKKTLIFVLIALLALTALTGCKKKAAANPFADMTTEQIIEKLYEDLPEGTELPMLANTAITSENISYYAGTDISFKEGTASEPLINAIAYSVCVFRLNDSKDSTDVQAAIKANVNPNKWICVGVDEQNVIVDGAGDIVILIMADGASTLHDTFKKLAGK